MNKSTQEMLMPEHKLTNEQGLTISTSASLVQNGLLREGLHEGDYFDEKGKKIKEFSVIKIFHFKGVNGKGTGRKNYFMYKWVKQIEFNGKWTWVALHLSDDSGDYFHLRTIADKDRVLKGVEVVQEPFA